MVISGALDPDLRSFLAMRFPEASKDAQLQNAIRENLYTNTVPCKITFTRVELPPACLLLSTVSSCCIDSGNRTSSRELIRSCAKEVGMKVKTVSK